MIVYSSNTACMIYLKDKKSIYMAIEGFVDSEKIQNFTKQMLDVCRKEKVLYLLVDTSQIKVIKCKDITWIQKNVVSHFEELGIEKVGYVDSQNIFGDISIHQLISENNKSAFRFFPSVESAEKWLYQPRKAKAMLKEIA